MKKGIKLDIRLTLILFAIIPMLVASLVLTLVTVNRSSKAMKEATHNSLVAVIEGVGHSFDNATETSETTLRNFIQSPIVTEYLKNPDDAKLAAKAQQYTLDYYGNLNGWEGLYLADWNSKVLTHPAEAVIGRVMREGDRLKELQDAMLASDGVYNVGIITSPASGQLIMSMYAPVFDESGKPIGYVGAGTFVNSTAQAFTDVSALNLSSAYIYFVDPTGTMLVHPDEEKIGNPVENEAVKNVLARLDAGEEVKPECIEYEYKGKMKYASVYVGENNAYVAVLTADEAEVMSSKKTITYTALILGLILMAAGVAAAVVLSSKVSNPLKEVTNATVKLSSGDVTVDCNAISHIYEIGSIVGAFRNLKFALQNSMTNVKESAEELSSAIVNVDGKTTDNVEAITQISTAIDEVASTSQTVADDAQVMAEKSVELGSEIESLTDNVDRLHKGSEVIQEANEEATACMQSVYEGSMQSVEAVESIAQKIADTNSAVEKIDSALQQIEAIAAQTNLLSLNASIEASRAGEAGRGFTIVAQEIRTLAESSAESSREIKQIVEEIMSLSSATVSISGKVRDVINHQQSDIEKAQNKFSKLSETVADSLDEIETIRQITEQMNAIKEEVATATSELGAISEQLGASAEEVAASCQTVSAACTDTQASTEEMRAINENMSSAIDYFRLD